MAWTEPRGEKFIGMFRDAEGKRHSAGTHPKKRAALKAAQDKESDARNGRFHDVTAGRVTFSDYFERDWLPNRIGELNSVATWQSHYDAYLKRAFGKTDVGKISPAMVQRWVVQLQKQASRQTKKPLAPATVRAVHRTLASVLGAKRGVSAVRDGLIATSPCLDTTLPVVDRPEVQVYDVKDVDILMKEIDQWFRPLVMLDSESALRWGELLGLQVSDFVEDYSAFVVSRTIVQVTKKLAASAGSESRFVVKNRPKGRKSRRVAITPEAATAVRTMVRERHLFPKDRLFSMPDADRTGPLRTEEWPTGQPISRSYFRTYVWTRAHESAAAKGHEIKQRKVHAVRASHITWLLAGGVDLATIMERVGHADLKTLQRYTGVLGEPDRRALDALEAFRLRERGDEQHG